MAPTTKSQFCSMMSEAPKPLDDPGKGTTTKNPKQDIIMEDSQSSNTQDTPATMQSGLTREETEDTNKTIKKFQHMRKSMADSNISRPLTPEGYRMELEEARRCKRLNQRRAKKAEKRAMGNLLDGFNTMTLGSTQEESASSSMSMDSPYEADSEDNIAE